MPEAEEKRLKKLKKPDRMLMVSSSPHIHSGESIQRVMWTVVICLLPASLVGVYFFGAAALKVIGFCVVGSVVVEAAIQKFLGKPVTIADGSAVITGLLLALNLPSNVPWWLCLIGALVAVALLWWKRDAFGRLLS